MDPRYGKNGKELRLAPIGSLIDCNTSPSQLGPGPYGVMDDDFSSHYAESRPSRELFPALVLERGEHRTKVLTVIGDVTWLSNGAYIQVMQEG